MAAAAVDVVGGVDLGALFVESGAPLPGPGASVLEVERAAWGPMCKQNFLAVSCPVSDGDRIPRLESVSSDARGRLVFDVFMPAALGGARVEGLRSALLEHRSGVQAVNVRALDDPGRHRFVLATEKLPEMLPWDGSLLFDDPTRIRMGKLISGVEAVWNLKTEFHQLIVGRTGGGKTALVRLELEQFASHGASGLVITPKPEDDNLTMFDELDGWESFCGESDEVFDAAHAALMGLKPEYERRMLNLGSDGYYDGPYQVVCMDEIGYSIAPEAADSVERKQQKAEIAGFLKKMGQKGRQAKIAVIGMCQDPYAENFGKNAALLNQFSCRVCVGFLDSKFHSTVFALGGADAQPAHLARVLGKKHSPGRGIVSGVEEPPDDPYAETEKVEVQTYWHDPADTHATIRRIAGGAAAAVVEAPPLVDEGERVDAELDALDLELKQLVDGYTPSFEPLPDVPSDLVLEQKQWVEEGEQGHEHPEHVFHGKPLLSNGQARLVAVVALAYMWTFIAYQVGMRAASLIAAGSVAAAVVVHRATNRTERGQGVPLVVPAAVIVVIALAGVALKALVS